MEKKYLLTLGLSLLSVVSFSMPPGGPKGAGGATGGAAPSTGGGASSQIQLGYHYFINNIHFDLEFPFFHVQYKPISYLTTRQFKVPGRNCKVPKNIATFILQYDSFNKKYVKVDSARAKNNAGRDTIIYTNIGKPIYQAKPYKDSIIDSVTPSGTLYYIKISVKKPVTKHAIDTCSSYVRYIVTDSNGIKVAKQGPDTMITVTQTDTLVKYFPKVLSLVKIGIAQDSGKIQLLINGKEKLAVPSVEIEINIDSLSRIVSRSVNESQNGVSISSFGIEQVNDSIQTKVNENSNKIKSWQQSIRGIEKSQKQINNRVGYDHIGANAFFADPSNLIESVNLQDKKNRFEDSVKAEQEKTKNLLVDLLAKQEIKNGIDASDKYTDNEKEFLKRYLHHVRTLVRIDSNKYDSCRYCGHKHALDTTQNGAHIYANSLRWIYPTIVDTTDSVNNFHLFIPKRRLVKDPVYIYRIPFARWQAGAVNIPLQYVPVAKDNALDQVSTSFLNVNAFFGRAWGNTTFYFDPAKTHTGFTGMVSVFAGVGQLPTLVNAGAGKPTAANNVQNADLAGTTQLGTSYGIGATVTYDILNFGFFIGNTDEIGSGQLARGWYYENKLWIGFGIGLNIGIFNNALTNAWE